MGEATQRDRAGTRGHFLDELRAAFDNVGAAADKRVLVYCGGGIAASLPDICVMGVIQHSNELVHVCHCPVRVDGKDDLVATGEAFWSPLNEVMKWQSPVPHSVRLSVALCRAGLMNWSFTNNGPIVGLNLEGWQ